MKHLTLTAVSVLLIGLTMSGTAYSQVPQIERDALVALYNSTDGDNWETKTRWLGAAGTECHWHGVTCSSGFVSRILLPYNSLSGSIPAELSNLTNLINLNLSYNSLSGSIPAELGNLTNLTSFHFEWNSLSGSIPAELGNLTNLAALTLSTNSLSGSIPAELGNLTNLTRLTLSNNSLSGSIPAELGNLTNLTRLTLSNNSLSGSIPAELANLTALTFLNLSTNFLTGPLPHWLSDMAIYSLSTTDAFTSPLVVAIEGGSRAIADTDGIAGESVSFTGTATDSDGTIATTEWLVGGSVVATGLTPTIALPNGSTVVTFKATDNDGVSSTKTVTITVATPTYTVTDEWPSPYNGVTPDSSFGLAFNNVGVFNSSDATIYVCLRIFTDGLPSSVNGVSKFDIGLKVVSLSDVTVQITKSREFNTIGALNESAQTPDCSGIFETTTGVYTDIIQTDTSVLKTTWSLIDPTNLILKLDSFKELTAN
jgi:hypothetical protein